MIANNDFDLEFFNPTKDPFLCPHNNNKNSNNNNDNNNKNNNNNNSNNNNNNNNNNYLKFQLSGDTARVTARKRTR